jgi:predicted nuclease of restriction endonuclease-like (RecB) superfamily
MKSIENDKFNFEFLADAISSIHKHFYHKSIKAINTNITIRNWIIGLYIVEYEQNGDDRAKYGKRLIDELAKQITIKGISLTTLKLSRKFYQIYPQIGQTVSDFLPDELSIPKISQTASDQSAIYQIKPQKLLESFSFSHFTELIKISDSHKRLFYEVECLKGSWSVRELKRQISSLFYERTGLSKNKAELIIETHQKSINQRTKEIIKDPFLFEFLELEKFPKVNETDLENELLNHLQSFILELGNGFCFEARQKRIIIGGEYFYIDLVFYHRK